MILMTPLDGLHIDSGLMAAIISALFGGAGLKIIEKMLSKKDQTFIDASAIRQELRQQIEDLRKEIEELRIELETAERRSNEWRDKYWKLVQETIKIQADAHHTDVHPTME